MWHVFASVAHFSKCGAFYQVWRIFPSLAQFSKSEAFFKVWCILRNFKPRQLGVTLEFPGLENILEGLGNRAEVGENYHARKAVSATLSVLKWSGATFRPRSSKVNVQKVLLCPFHYEPRQSGVSLESPGLGNISQVPGNLAEVGQNHDARNLVSGTLWVLKWSRAIFRPRGSKVSVQRVMLFPFHCKTKPSGFSLESPGLQNIPQVPRNRAEVGQNHNAHKAVSATLSVLKWSRAIFRPIRSKVRVQKAWLCPFHCKAKPSGVSLESPGLENIPQVPANGAKVSQNHDARKAFSSTLSVLKWSGAMFRPVSSTPSVR